jgi:hypothetical protein
MERLTKYVFISAGVMLFGFFAHNFWYAIFGREDAVFFLLTFLGFLLMVILSIITAYSVVRKGRPKDAWILGFVGVALEIVVVLLKFNKAVFYLIPLPFLLFFIQYFTGRRELKRPTDR